MLDECSTSGHRARVHLTRCSLIAWRYGQLLTAVLEPEIIVLLDDDAYVFAVEEGVT